MPAKPSKFFALSSAAALYNSSRQARWAMASQIVTSGANFITTLIIVRSLGLADFGRFSVCFLLMMVTRNFLNGLVLIPMSTIGPKLSGVSARSYRGFLAANGLAFSLGSSVLLFALAHPLGHLLNAPWLAGLSLSLVAANLTANGADFIRRYHFVYESSAWAFAVDAIRFGVQLGLLGGLAFALPSQFSVASALWALALGGLIATAIGTLHYGAMGWSARLSRTVWPRHWNFIKWMTPNLAFEALQNNGVMLAGGAVFGDVAMGIIRSMQTIANTLNLPLNVLQQIAPSAVARQLALRGKVAVLPLLARILTWSLLLVASIAIAVVIFASPLIGGLMKISPADALPVLILFFLVNVATVVRMPIILALQALERPEALFWASAVGVCVAAITFFGLPSDLGSVTVPLTRLSVIMLASVAAVVFGWSSLSDLKREGPSL